MTAFDYLLLAAALFLLVGVLASKASGRLGVPALLLFLVVGMLAGSEGIGGIHFDNASIAQSLGVVALVFILYSGGLDTDWQAVRPVLPQGFTLATLGVFLTALLVGLFATYVLDFPLYASLLLGSIVSSTDAAAVFSVLRSKGVGLQGYLRPLLELESGSNDPMAIFLTTAFIGLMVSPGTSILQLFPSFLQQMIVGALAGFVLGKGMVFIINRLNLEYEGLYTVLSLGLVLLVYTLPLLVGGNGFLAVYLAGLVVGNSTVLHRRSLMRFHDGVAWLMQITMFLTLGLLVFPTRLLAVTGQGLLLSAVLILVARPISVFLSLIPFRMPVAEKALISWVGLRGAVPIVLATFPLLAGVEQADIIFNLVFFIVLTSVLLQGSTIPIVARWLKVDAPLRNRPRSPLEMDYIEGLDGQLFELELPPDSPAAGRRLFELKLPTGVLLALIGRDSTFLIPRGGTQLESGDVLYLLADQETLPKVKEFLHLET